MRGFLTTAVAIAVGIAAGLLLNRLILHVF